MLKDFFQITERSNDGASNYRYQLVLNPQHSIYQGHFPNMPVLPGVCMLHIIKACVEGHVQKSLRYETIANCKFTSVVNPTENDTLELSFGIDTDLKLQANLYQGDNVVLKIKASFREV